MPDNNFVNVMLISGNINYFNRIIKKYDTLAEYQALGSYYTTTLNFDPGNNLTTNLIIGSTTVNALTFDCNYLLIYNSNNEILQRWWVMDQKRTRAGQYTLSLKRDVIADFYDIVTEAPCFIEKATIRNKESALMFNKEDMTFNQIKRSETLLKDETGMAWIVGYVARNYASAPIPAIYDVKADYNYNQLTALGFAVGNTYKGALNIKLQLGLRHNFYYQSSLMAAYQANDSLVYSDSSFSEVYENTEAMEYVGNYYLPKYVYYKDFTTQNPGPDHAYLSLVKSQINLIRAAVQTDFESQYSLISPDKLTTLYNLEGKIYTNDGKYYKLKVKKSVLQVTQNLQSYSVFGTRIDAAIKAPVNANLVSLTPNYNNVGGYTTINYREISVTLEAEEFQPDSYNFSFPGTRRRTIDAPYDIFAIPYPLEPTEVVETYTNSSTYSKFEINNLNSINLAQAIGANLASNLYDIQILPYCPINKSMGTFTFDSNPDQIRLLDLREMTPDVDYTIVKDNNDNPVGIIYFSGQSGKTFNIKHTIMVSDPKIDNETKMYRLVSPNYSGMFEFSPAMNGGVDYFNVDITYKPYQPYIHVNPNFKHMYGNDFNDVRGLVCGGDYSVAIVTDQWKQFEVNNKNYQMIFDREVQNMEFTREQDRVKQVVGGLVGTVQGSAQGGMAGGWIGAVVGGVASAAGGATDFWMEEQKYKEQLSLKKDLYGYNLGNIKALPYSLTKSMSLNENFKFWPFLEYYSCSIEEYDAFSKKIQYDGMTVMKIGKMSDYMREDISFIKGQIIRLENLPEATDVAYEIFNEIKRGVYI